MATEWPIRTVAECASTEPYSTQIGPFGEKIRAESYTATGAPVLRGTNVNPDGRFHDDDFVFIDPELAEAEFGKFVCEADDVILCHKGTLGKIGIIPKKSRFKKYIMGNSMMKVRCDRSKLEPLYLYYWLSSRDGQDYISSRVSQVGVPQIQRPLSTLREASFPVPPLAEQKAIAAVLGALDDKIELNRRMNVTLEAMARALFQSWFVDFDPVRAKLDGSPPAALDPMLAALFPANFQTTEGERIPKGWEWVPLEALASIRGGKQLPTEDCLPLGKFKVFGANGVMGYAAESTHAGFVIAFGRVGAYCGSIHWSLDSAWINNNASAVVPLQWPAFVLQAMLNIDFKSMRTGSAQPFIPNSSLASAKVLRPSAAVAEAFCRIVGPIRRQQADNEEQSRILGALRDTLLPKLLSGHLKAIG